MNPEFFTASERLLSAAANGLYQGILVAALAALVLRLVPRTNAATRHAIWVGALAFVTALIPAHLLFSYLQDARAQRDAARLASSMKTLDSASSDNEATIAPAVDDGDLPGPRPAESVGESAGDPPSLAAASDGDGAGTETDSGDRTRPALAANIWPRLKSAIGERLSFKPETPINLPRWLSLGLVSAWVLLAGIRGSQIVRRLVEIRRAKNASSGPGDDLQSLFDKLRNALPARRNVRLRMSNAHSSAVVLGFAHPVVLLPADIDKDLPADDVEHVMRHELAHVARWDDWGNLIQQGVEAALFFHPAVWWISRKLSLEREIACDDHVLEASDRPRAYALTLANVASRMNQCRHLLSPGVSNNHSQLQQRINMILNTNRDRSSRLATRRLGVFTTATALLAVLAITAGPRLVLAQSGPAAPAPPPAPSADGTPAALPPDSQDESGPRSKNADPAARALVLQAPPTPATPAEPPTPGPVPVAAVSVTPDVTARVNVSVSDDSDVAPAPPAPPKHPGAKHNNMSVEERLDRIERILKEMQEHRRSGGGSGGAWAYSAGPGPDAFVAHGNGPDGNGNADWVFKGNPDLAFKFADEQAKRAAEEAKRAAEAGQRAAEAGQRAAEAGQRSVEQAMRKLEKLKDGDFDKMQKDLQEKLEKLKGPDFEKMQKELQDRMRDMQVDGSAREIEALRSARDSLAREMENLSRQIRQLEHNERHLNKHKDHKDGKDGDDSDDDSDNKPEKPEAPDKQ